MPADRRKDEKQRVLRQHSTLNPRPDAVTHPLFRDSEFFDPTTCFKVTKSARNGACGEAVTPR
jgi:hypothetical protein